MKRRWIGWIGLMSLTAATTALAEENVRNLGGYVKPVFRRGELGGAIVDAVVSGDLCWPSHFWPRPRLHLPKSKVLEDLFDDFLVLDHADDFPLLGTFGASLEGPPSRIKSGTWEHMAANHGRASKIFSFFSSLDR